MQQGGTMLTDSERQEVQYLTREGYSGRKISQMLGLDVKTVQKLMKIDPSGTLSSKVLKKKLNIATYLEPSIEFGSRCYRGTRVRQLYLEYSVIEPPSGFILYQKSKFYIAIRKKANEFCEALRNRERKKPLYVFLVRQDVLQLADVIGSGFRGVIREIFEDTSRDENENIKRSMKLVNLVAGDASIFEELDDFIEELRFKSIPTRWHYAKVMFWLIDARKQGKFRKKWAKKFYEIKEKLLEKKEADILAKYPLL